MAAKANISRRAARYAVPAAVFGVAAGAIAMVPAFANSGGPDLPAVTAQQLLEKVAASDVQQLSGSAKITTDLGLPKLATGLLGGGGGIAGGSAAPEDKVAQLANGTHTFRVAADGPDRQKLTFLDGKDEYSLVHNGDDVWGYDSKSNEAFHEKAGKDAAPGAGKGGKDHKSADRLAASPQEMAQEVLKAAGPTTDISVGDTARVAGRDAYQLVLKPKANGSTVGSVKIAVDAGNGVPLRVQLLSTEGGKPIVDAGFTKVDFAKPAADTFAFTPPKGVKVTEGGPEGHGKGEGRGLKGLESIPGLDALTGAADGKGEVKVLGEGWASIARIETGSQKGLKDLENDKDAPKEAKQFLDALGDKVSGKFGEGRVFKTRLVNALITDDGKVYVGAVTKDALVKAADAHK
ncbi:outer membrane lipoprotein carrier protein LolA [Streptomyces sp. NPDC091268]|uniref:LolA family protein n=1 Tax=Streptomyces sp. NPDC091268 TaxID=3365979 RepID=UPI0037F2A19F